MAEINDFEDFYNQKIGPLVLDHKKRSILYDRWGYVFAGSLLFFFVSIIAALQFRVQGAAYVCLFAVAFLVFTVFKFASIQISFTGNFKKRIITEIVDFVLPGNEYKPDSYISTKLFKASCLYRFRVNNIEGDDFIKGRYKNVAFQGCELWTYTGRPDVSNEGMLFKGLFFAADLGSFSGGTYIWRKNNIQLGDSIADERYRLFPIPRVQKINTGSPQFDKYYHVYSTYPTEAHTILTADMMQQILSFRQQLKKEISLSFVAGRCYVAIPFNQKLLEPATDLTDKDAIKEYFFTILLYPAIINQLKLYEYI